MTTKMDRRTFLKGAAAAAAAVSLSGLLTGCGGDQELPDNAVQLGVFNVSIYGLNVNQGAELGGDAGAITGTVKIRFSDSGSSTQAVPYRGMFNATVGGSKLTQVAPTGNLVVSDALLGKPFATKEKDLKLSFPDVATREAYQSGLPERKACLPDHYHQRHDRCAVPGKAGQRIRCHQNGRLIGSRTLCPGHSGKSARGFLPFCPGAEGWF